MMTRRPRSQGARRIVVSRLRNRHRRHRAAVAAEMVAVVQAVNMELAQGVSMQ